MAALHGRFGSRSIALLLVLVVVLGALPGVAAAATRTGGTVVVEEGETVDGLTAYGGTIVVRGTVDGDLTAFGGNVYVRGEVTGSVEAFAGNVRVSGRVGGDVSATAGNVVVEEGAVIGGDLSAAGGSVVVDGTVRGNAKLAGGSVTLSSSTTIEGDLTYSIGEDGEFTRGGATIGGTIEEKDELSMGGPTGVPKIAGWLFGIYGFLVNLLVGAVLLLVFPGTSRRIADRVAEEPLRTGGIGLLALIATPIGLVLLMLTIVGIPLSLVGVLLYGLAIWLGVIYGRFAVGSWLLSRADVENRWGALLVGMVAVAVLARIPVVGGILDFAVFLLGFGALAAVGYAGLRRRRGETPAEDASAASAA